RAARENIRLPVPECLPHEPGPAALIGGNTMPDIRSRRLRQAHFLTELAILVSPAVKVPVVFALAGPDDPERIAVCACDGNAEMIAGPGDFQRLRPRSFRTVAFDEENAVFLSRILHPGEIVFAGFVAHPEGRIVVLNRVGCI